MLLATSDYGPFAPVVGYAGAIMAAGSAIFVLWGGRMKRWRPPNKDLPGTAQSFVLLLCGVLMVVEFFFAEPSLVRWMIGAVVVIALGSVLCYFKYDELIGLYGYQKPVHGNGGKVEKELIFGGRKLRPEAEKIRKTKHITDNQILLEGAAYNVGELWDRNELSWVRKRVLGYFISMLVLGTSALTMAGFTTQVILTKRAATSVINRDDAPGLKQTPTPSPK
jgi:hypothetical protein